MKHKIYPGIIYPFHGTTPGATIAPVGDGYVAITKYIPVNVDKCIFAEFINASKNIDESLFGGTSIGFQLPGDITIALVVATDAIAPGGGIIGGMGMRVAPVQYVIMAGPISWSKFGCLLCWVCLKREVNRDCSPDKFPTAIGTLLTVSPPALTAESYANANEAAKLSKLEPYACDCIEGNNDDLNVPQDIIV